MSLENLLNGSRTDYDKYLIQVGINLKKHKLSFICLSSLFGNQYNQLFALCCFCMPTFEIKQNSHCLADGFRPDNECID